MPNTNMPLGNDLEYPDLWKLYKSAQSLEVTGDYRKSYDLLRRCDQLQKSTCNGETLSASVQAGLWRLNPLWWANIEHNDLRLRRCRDSDAAFFQRCYNDTEFSRQFNRQQPWTGDLEKALAKSGKLPPIQTGLLMWVVESASTGPLGLASLSSIDTANYRAELSIGFPGNVPPTIAVKTTLMMLHFALVLMPFNKVYSYVYEDNPQALHNALRFGFLCEGTLRDHFRIPGHGFLTVSTIGLTRAQLLANDVLKVLAKRRIGQHW